MSYIKTGATVRLERARGQRTILHLDEGGVAEESGRTFRCRSSEKVQRLVEPPVESVLSVEKDVLDSGAVVERMTIVAGRSRHHFLERSWEESHIRLHLSIVREKRRVTIELGGAEWNEGCRAVLREIAVAASSIDASPVSGPILLRPAVSAQLWPELLIALLAERRDEVRVRQGTHDEYRFDGFGEAISPFTLIGKGGTVPPDRWPNSFRPSYRVRPVRAAFHIDADLAAASSTLDVEAEAVALLSPFSISEGRVRAEVLCSDGRSAQLDASLESLRQVNGERAWFPYAAGSWGKLVLVPRRSTRG